MSGVESAALRLGSAVVGQVARTWLGRKRAEVRRGADLTELIGFRFGGLRERDRRGLHRRLDEVAEHVGDRLEQLCDREFAALPEHERVAALDAVADALAEADLSDTALLGADLDPVRLARRVRRQVPPAAPRTGLGEVGRALFDRALDDGCVQLVHLVRELPEYDARLAEESLRRATGILAEVREVLDRLPVTSLDAPSGTDHDEAFRRRYLDLLARHHDDLELIGVSVRNFRPRTRLSVAYLSLTVSGGLPKPDHHEHWLTGHDDRARSLRVEAALSLTQRTLVRGDAGSGKSTLLRWIAVRAARGDFGPDLASWNDRVPVLIKLRSHAGGALPRPEDFLDEPDGPMPGPAPEGWMHRQLTAGRVVLLVDGVDELTAAERPKVRRWLDALLTSYPDTRIVITSRPAAAGTKWLRSEGFTTVDLEQLTPGDVREFLRRWHDALLAADTGALPFSRAEVEQQHRGLLAKLDARPHLRSLARSPLMCAMLCALNLDRGGELPRDRKGLYEAALEMILDRRDSVREIPSTVALEYRDKLVLLQELAFWLNLNGRAELPREQALALLAAKTAEPEAVLTHLIERSGVIREPAEGRVDFVHRTFQEFLAARKAADESHVGLLVQKAHSDQWRETVIMSAGLLNRRGRADLLNGVLDRADSGRPKPRRRLRLLAAACRESAHDLPPEVSDRLDAAIGALVPPRSHRESQSLATIGEPVLDRLPDDLSALTEAQAAATVRTVALVNGPEALHKLSRFAADERAAVQRELAERWPLFEPESYARSVLANAPLDGGDLFVREWGLLPHLHHVRELADLNVSVTGSGEHGLSPLSHARHLSALSLHDAGEISLRPLEEHLGLQSVMLDTRVRFHDLDVLSGLRQLTDLVLVQQAPFEDLSFLEGCPPLRGLALSSKPLDVDYGPAASIKSLYYLHVYNVHRASALRPFSTHKGLNSLSVSTSDTSGLAEVLPNFTGIRELYVFMGSLTDLEPLPSMELAKLVLSRHPPTLDLTPVRSMSSLRDLHLSYCDGLDLAPLADLDLRLKLHRRGTYRGLDQLGPGVRVTWIR
ncbi:NACHT domain-containing protein [Saccharopolyspora cebuensis]|uniref:NACHT domain-containing NTPase n=1 Tax=Saccharopolyspora cebuensis TaxID=418759 RepID=A0ABV4CT73_9PSEU